MKIKNKKRTNIILLAFLTVFMAGAAFAFTAQSPLIFQGTANVDAALRLEIVEGFITGNPATQGIEEPRVGNRFVQDSNGRYPRLVNFNIGFNRPGAAQVTFHIENTGTLPATIDTATLYLSTDDIIVNDLPWNDSHPLWGYHFAAGTWQHNIMYLYSEWRIGAGAWTAGAAGQTWNNFDPDRGEWVLNLNNIITLQPGEVAYVRVGYRFMQGAPQTGVVADIHQVSGDFNSRMELSYIAAN